MGMEEQGMQTAVQQDGATVGEGGRGRRAGEQAGGKDEGRDDGRGGDDGRCNEG